MIEKFKISPENAIKKLEGLQLNLLCGEELRTSIPLQAALLTAVNTAKRAFLGGVYVEIPTDVQCLLPWPGNKTLSDVVKEMGGAVSHQCDRSIFNLSFGVPASIDDNAIQVVCNDWQGGVMTEGETFKCGFSGTIPTAGIFAGGLAVALAFFKASGINISACDTSVGVSLWRPDLHWLEPSACGPTIAFLPKKYWLLGLGHLGQAYLWNIGLLPYRESDMAEILLNDFDKIVKGNWSAGLLCELIDKGQKTRLCSRWLESRGFETVISERAFDEYTRRIKNEPFLALCGFDNAKSRHFLEEAGFDLVIESGLGSSLHTFDIIAMHTFPGTGKSAKEIWPLQANEEVEINKTVHDILKEFDKNECGIIPLTIAGKTLSASFVGACAGALVVAESLRALHGGMRYDKIVFQLRNVSDKAIVNNQHQRYSTELARNGWASL